MDKLNYSVGTGRSNLHLPRRPSFTDNTSLVKPNQPFMRFISSLLPVSERKSPGRFLPGKNPQKRTNENGRFTGLKMWRGGLSTCLFKKWEEVLDLSRIFFCNLWLCAPLSHILHVGHPQVQILLRKVEDGNTNWAHSFAYSFSSERKVSWKRNVNLIMSGKTMSTVQRWPYINTVGWLK